MSTQIREQLDELVATAPSGGLDPDALWGRGRRRQAVRLVASMACLLVVAGLGATALPVVDRFQQQVASGTSALRLPDRIRQPGAFEPTFPRAPGPLVAVGLGDRSGLWSSEPAWWGVSGVSGASRFLDLPDAVVSSDTMPSLSSDGRRLAYWITGEITDEPVRVLGDVPVVGLAVMDLVTGESLRQELATAHGLGVGTLAWVGDRLFWSAGAIEDVNDAGDSWGYTLTAHTWDVVRDEREEPDQRSSRTWIDADETGPAPGGFVSLGRRRVVWTTSEGSRSFPLEVRGGLGGSLWAPVAVSPDGSRLAGVHQQGGGERAVLDPHPLFVGDIRSEGVVVRPLGDLEPSRVLGWRSPDEVVVEVRGEPGAEAVSVDVDTGEATPLAALEGNPPSFAAEVWTGESVRTPGPPWSPDPRLLALGVAVGVGAGWWAVVMVRRRLVRA